MCRSFKRRGGKSRLAFIIFAAGLIPGLSLAQTLMAPAGPSTTDPTGISALNIRQGTIHVYPERLRNHQTRYVRLHLFGDLTLHASLLRVPLPSAQDIWRGESRDPACQVILATDYQTLAANISCPAGHYQVRPGDGGDHRVRQMGAPARIQRPRTSSQLKSSGQRVFHAGVF